MKSIWLTLLGALVLFGIIHYMNKVAPTPMPGLTSNGKTVVSTPASSSSPADEFEPLDLSFSSGGLVKSANAQELKPTAVLALTKTSPRTMGDENAPVEMFVFSSLTCSHCADFHTKALKEIEEKYVKSGKVFFTYVDYPFDNRALAGAMLARCVNPENYFTFLNVLFENQKNWAFKPNAQEIVTAYASLQGMTKGDVKACLADKTLQQKIISTRDKYAKEYQITGTPTTVVIKGNKTEIIAGADENKLNAVLAEMTKE